MENAVPQKKSIREKVVHEFRELAVLTAYLYVCFAALIGFKASILQAENIHYASFGVAAVKAAICAKFMLVGFMLQLGQRFKGQPLIIPVLHKAFVFLLFLVLLTLVEEIIVGMIRGHTVVESIAEVGGGTLGQMAATCLVMMLILIPYFAFRALGELVGERNLVRLFLEKRKGSP